MPDIENVYQAALIISFPLTLAVMVMLIIVILFLHSHRTMAARCERR